MSLRWADGLDLASGEELCRLQLEQEEVLRVFGNDFTDFYHSFEVSCPRAARNSLNILIPEAVGRVYRAYQPAKVLQWGIVRQSSLLKPCQLALALRFRRFEPELCTTSTRGSST